MSVNHNNIRKKGEQDNDNVCHSHHWEDAYVVGRALAAYMVAYTVQAGEAPYQAS